MVEIDGRNWWSQFTIAMAEIDGSSGSAAQGRGISGLSCARTGRKKERVERKNTLISINDASIKGASPRRGARLSLERDLRTNVPPVPKRDGGWPHLKLQNAAGTNRARISGWSVYSLVHG
ncbi:hypothetical protein [Bradyrhizobium sp.]|uniref:hypothetical protein n=1 Tax=Bradyrhizobium sp. TaxID=376 RepID=UPI003C612D8A